MSAAGSVPPWAAAPGTPLLANASAAYAASGHVPEAWLL